METLPNVIQNNLQKIWDPTCRSVCIPPLPPASTIHVMATGSAEHSNRCIKSGLEESVLLCFPPIFPNRSSVKKSSERPDQIDHCYARLAEPILVPDFVENGNCRLIPFTQTSKDSFEPRRQNSSFSSEVKSEVSGMADVRKNLSSEGISERAIQIPEGKVLSQITNRPGESGLAGVMGSKLIPLATNYVLLPIFLQICFIQV